MNEEGKTLHDHLGNVHPGLGPGADFCYTFVHLRFHKDVRIGEFHSHFTDGQLRLKEVTHLVKWRNWGWNYQATSTSECVNKRGSK